MFGGQSCKLLLMLVSSFGSGGVSSALRMFLFLFVYELVNQQPIKPIINQLEHDVNKLDTPISLTELHSWVLGGRA